jgi:hypothetical protein
LKKQSKYSRFICRSAEIFSFVTKIVNEHVDLEKFDVQEVLDCLLESSVEDWLEFKETEYKLFWRSLKTLIDTGMLSKFVLNLLRNFIKIFPKELNKKSRSNETGWREFGGRDNFVRETKFHIFSDRFNNRLS